MRTIQYAILILFLSKISLGQSIKRQEMDIESLSQKLIPLFQEEDNLEAIIENLYALYQDPLNLNTATAEDLRNLYLLSDFEINTILKHRENMGDFLSLYELQSIPNLSLDKIKQILPFILLKPTQLSTYIPQIIKNASEHFIVFRTEQTLENSKAFQENLYLGNKQKQYFRYQLKLPKHYSLGFISEKDPGEKNMLDHTAFHLQIQNKGNLKNLILGDFNGQFGQGLILSSGYSPGKSSEPIYSSRRNNLGFRPYTSLIEGSGYRGVSGTYKLSKIHISPMFSIKRRHGNAESNPETNEELFTSILTSGLFRTEKELENKNSFQETNAGVNANYKSENFQVGLTGLYTHYNLPFERSATNYNAFEFRGKNNFIIGPNFDFYYQNLTFFGEIARSSSGGWGSNLGIIAALGPKLEYALGFRKYDKDFHTFNGAGFSEGTRSINETGVYNGIKYAPIRKLIISAYYDVFRFPWLRFRVDSPSYGSDYQVRTDYKHTRERIFFALIHKEKKQVNSSLPDLKNNYLVNTDRWIGSIGMDLNFKRRFRMQTKIQTNTFETEEKIKTWGWAFIQDLECKFYRISIKTRVSRFKTDAYDNRIYAYENDVLYVISFPAYYGNGWRYYSIFKINLHPKVDVWFRWSQTQLLKNQNIGSGNDLLGNNRNDVKLQIKYSIN
ncbi:MAG: ComEA family DNA-binding protein [Leadbetterella sp.]